MRKMKKMSGEGVSLVVLGPPPSQFRARARGITVLFAAFVVISGVTVSGCDAISEFLGLGGPAEDSSKNPSETQNPPLPEPLAQSDGEEPIVRYVDENDPSQGIYEIHVFEAREDQNEFMLAFPQGTETVGNVDYLIVAGGGGAGGDDDRYEEDDPGGGGAGGLLYKTNQSLALTDGSVTVTVGTGGAGGGTRSQGTDGGNSAIGNIIVPGGGGGGGAYNTLTIMSGRPGGSGGGAGAAANPTSGNSGAGKSKMEGSTENIVGDPDLCGNSGGTAGTNVGGGGGGAGGPGNNGAETGANPGEGGAPWIPPDEATWIVTVLGASEFSRGGSSNNSVATPSPGFGNGGSIVPTKSGGDGYAGIVVIRFLRQANGELPAGTGVP